MRPYSTTLIQKRLLLALWCFTACSTRRQSEVLAADTARTPSASLRVDCLGSDSIVAISAGHAGALQLDLPLDSIRRLCATARDTTVNGDEMLDTAIVISRPALRIIGDIATVDDDGRQPVHLDASTRIRYWSITGSAGVLPGGIPLTATLGSLTRAYGPVEGVDQLNGDVFVTFCHAPGFSFNMIVPRPIQEKYDRDHQAAFDSAAADSRIGVINVSSIPRPVDPANTTCR